MIGLAVISGRSCNKYSGNGDKEKCYEMEILLEEREAFLEARVKPYDELEAEQSLDPLEDHLGLIFDVVYLGSETLAKLAVFFLAGFHRETLESLLVLCQRTYRRIGERNSPGTCKIMSFVSHPVISSNKEAQLQWKGCWMKNLLLVGTTFLMGLNVYAQDKVIYGNDDRQDVAAVFDNLLVDKARSTAGMFSSTALSLQSNGYYKVIGKTLVERGWCASERFSNQITAPTCTGFLIAPDVLATAGHCISKSSDCKNYSWAFDYKLASVTDTTAVIPKSSVYRCKAIIATVNSSTTKDDYAIIRLDRVVTDRSPLNIRQSGKIADDASLVLIGHPKGLPMKIAGGAKVRSNTPTKYFVANLDSYGGNSGSPVVNAATGEVEGILVRGETDSVTTSSGCSVSNVCPDTGCGGEDVTRITNLPKI